MGGIIILLSVACQPSTQVAERELSTSVSAPALVTHVPTRTPANPTLPPSPTGEEQMDSATHIPAQPTASLPPGSAEAAATAEAEPRAPLLAPDGDRLPIFVEMVRSPLLPPAAAPMPPADEWPVGAFVFDQSNRLLLVQPSAQILSTTEVLVGLTTAQVPGRPSLSRDLYQIPSSEPAPLDVLAIDAGTGTLTLGYADQIFELGLDESRSFKQKGEGELAVIEITTIINHGLLAGIGELPMDPASP
jgi:hypothetical protein